MKQQPERHPRRPDARAARRVRHDLREPAQRHDRGRQRCRSRAATRASCAAARRRSHSNTALARLVQRGARRRRACPPTAVQLVQTTDRDAVGQLIAMPRVRRRDHPARRQGPDRAHQPRGQGAGHQAPRRQLPRLCRRPVSTSTWPCASPTTPRRRSTAPATRPKALLVRARRGARRSCRRSARSSRPRAWRCAATRAAQALLRRPSPARTLVRRDRAGLVRGIPRADHQHQGGRRLDEAIAHINHYARTTPTRSSRATTCTRSASCARWIRPA